MFYVLSGLSFIFHISKDVNLLWSVQKNKTWKENICYRLFTATNQNYISQINTSFPFYSPRKGKENRLIEWEQVSSFKWKHFSLLNSLPFSLSPSPSLSLVYNIANNDIIWSYYNDFYGIITHLIWRNHQWQLKVRPFEIHISDTFTYLLIMYQKVL